MSFTFSDRKATDDRALVNSIGHAAAILGFLPEKLRQARAEARARAQLQMALIAAADRLDAGSPAAG